MLPDDLPELTLQAWPTCPTCTTPGFHHAIWCSLAWWTRSRSQMGWACDGNFLWPPVWQWHGNVADSEQSTDDASLVGPSSSSMPPWVPNTPNFHWGDFSREGHVDLEFSQQGLQSSSTVPLHYVFLGSPRSPLCLLGQIAAPIQVLWILSQFMRHLQEHCCLYSDINASSQAHHINDCTARNAEHFNGAGLPCDQPDPVGLGDTQVWQNMKMLLDFASKSATSTTALALYPFRATPTRCHQRLATELSELTRKHLCHLIGLCWPESYKMECDGLTMMDFPSLLWTPHELPPWLLRPSLTI